MSKRGLGRGLGALIPETSAFSHQEGELVLSLPVESIEPNPEQPRRDFDPAELAALTESIRDQGLLQPVLVRKLDETRYQLVAGERRLKAAKDAGFTRIPALLRVTEDRELLPLAMVENLQRSDLNPMEEARAYERLLAASPHTQEDLAERFGRSRAHVANALRLLKLPHEIQEQVAAGELSRGHALAILACDTERRMFALRDLILAEGLSVRESEERARASSSGRTPQRRRTALRSVCPEVRELEERLQRAYGTPVCVHERKGRGRVSLEFYSLDDLDRLVDLLLAAETAPIPR